MSSPNNIAGKDAADDFAAANAHASKAAKFEKPAEASVGEKWWKRITYTGIGYGANLLVSLAIWDFLLDGKGRPLFDKVVKAADKGLQAGGMEHTKAGALAFTATKMACSPLGGHFTMVPVKIFEDHARYITHKLNQNLDPNYKYKDLQVNWSTPDSELPGLADEPNRNTWGQVAMRRGLGWSAVIGSGIALNKSGFEQPLENWTLGKMQSGVKLTGNGALQRFSEKDVVQRWTKLAALDVYFTVITSAITALTKNTFGKARDTLDGADDALSVDIPGLTEDHAAPEKRFTEKHAPQKRAIPLKHTGNYQDMVASDKQNNAGLELR